MVDSLYIMDVNTNKIKKIFVNGIFISIGHIPNSIIFQNQLNIYNGYIKTHYKNNVNLTATNIDGVFAAGDVQDQSYRQAVTAAASGCMAALDAERYLHYFEEQLN